MELLLPWVQVSYKLKREIVSRQFDHSIRDPPPRPPANSIMVRLTLWKETSAAVEEVLSQKPTIAKLIVPLDEFDAITLGEAKLIRTPRLEVVWIRIRSVSILKAGGWESRRSSIDVMMYVVHVVSNRWKAL